MTNPATATTTVSRFPSAPLGALAHPGTPERKSRRDRRATEASLEAAALRLLARNGILGGLSLQEVASEAQISRALVYQNFGSRRALLRSALNTLKESGRSVVDSLRVLPFAQRRCLMFRVSARSPAFSRVEALLALDGDDEFAFFPSAEQLLDDLERDKAEGELDPALDSRAVHALCASIQLGYCIFRENFARELGVEAEVLDQRAEQVLDRMLASLGPISGTRDQRGRGQRRSSSGIRTT